MTGGERFAPAGRAYNCIQRLTEDYDIEASFGPESFLNISDRKIKDQMNIFIQAAKGRGEALDHVLYMDPRGLGKPLWPI